LRIPLNKLSTAWERKGAVPKTKKKSFCRRGKSTHLGPTLKKPWERGKETAKLLTGRNEGGKKNIF